jgi:hypothetical protein
VGDRAKGRRTAGLPLQDGVHGGEQRGRIDGLGDRTIHARLPVGGLLMGHDIGGQGENRRRRPGSPGLFLTDEPRGRDPSMTGI